MEKTCTVFIRIIHNIMRNIFVCIKLQFSSVPIPMGFSQNCLTSRSYFSMLESVLTSTTATATSGGMSPLNVH